jgi:hypothetical protein
MAKWLGGISVRGTGFASKRASRSSLGSIAGIAAASNNTGNVSLDTGESAAHG